MCWYLKMLIRLLIISVIANEYKIQALRIKITKLNCKELDNLFCKFEKCRIKAESRNVQYIAMYIKYFKLPITELSARIRFLKRANGYKPFLYDFVLKCDFLKHMDVVKRMVWQWFKDVSNLNHSCPFTEDFEIKRLDNHYLENNLAALPLVNGDYALFVEVAAHNVTRYITEFYVTVY